jgi:hypothetical protein
VALLSELAVTLEKFTGSRSTSVRLERDERSPSFQRSSGGCGVVVPLE